jgi:hypothetical protein
MFIRDVRSSRPLRVNSFPDLVELVAKISYNNPEYALFYRGQPEDFTVSSHGSTIMPSLYRLNGVGRRTKKSKRLVDRNFSSLKEAEEYLVKGFQEVAHDGIGRLRQFSEVCWAILQHYEVTPTPLLDLTTSLRVACSFATEYGTRDGVLMVLGMPHPHGSISYYVEEQLCNLRLLSICPPDVVRPYYQEGYAAGTFPTRDSNVRSSSHDFARLLIAKFQLSEDFWTTNFPAIPKTALYPTQDAMLTLTEDIKSKLTS